MWAGVDIPHERVAPNEEFPDDEPAGPATQWFDSPEPDPSPKLAMPIFPEWVVRIENVVVVRAPTADEAEDLADIEIDAGRVQSRLVSVDRK